MGKRSFSSIQHDKQPRQLERFVHHTTVNQSSHLKGTVFLEEDPPQWNETDLQVNRPKAYSDVNGC